AHVPRVALAGHARLRRCDRGRRDARRNRGRARGTDGHPVKVALRSGLTSVGRLSIHHTYGGSGSPVLFIHGLGSSGYIEWRFTLPAVAAHHRVFAPDLPGFGRSQKPRARYGIGYFARVLDRYLEGRRLRSAAVVGTS